MRRKLNGLCTLIVVLAACVTGLSILACKSDDADDLNRRETDVWRSCDSLIEDSLRVRWMRDSLCELGYRSAIASYIIRNSDLYVGASMDCINRLLGWPSSVGVQTVFYVLNRRKAERGGVSLCFRLDEDGHVVSVGYVIRD